MPSSSAMSEPEEICPEVNKSQKENQKVHAASKQGRVDGSWSRWAEREPREGGLLLSVVLEALPWGGGGGGLCLLIPSLRII